MKRKFKYKLLIIGLVLSCHATYAQQGQLVIKITQTTSGALCNIMTTGAQANANNYMSLHPNNLQECENLKREVLASPDFQSNCFTVQCDCVGYPASSSNSGSNGSNPFNSNNSNPFNNSQLNFNGLTQGQPFFSPVPYVDVEYWIDGVRYKGSVFRNIAPDFYNILKKNYNMRELDNNSSNFKPYVAKSGHEPFDGAFAGLVNNYINPTTEEKNIKGTEQPIGQDDLNKLQEIKDLLNANSSPEEGYAALVNIANKMPETSQSGVNLNVDNLNEVPPVESSRPYGILPSVKMSINENTIPSYSKKQAANNEEIKYEHPYIDLAAGTAKAAIGLAGTGTALVGILAVNLVKEDIKAWRDFDNYGKIASTGDIIYNAWVGEDGKVLKELLGTAAGGLVSSGIMKAGNTLLVKNAEKYGVTPLQAKEDAKQLKESASIVIKSMQEGKAWGTQLGKDYHNQNNKNQ